MNKCERVTKTYQKKSNHAVTAIQLKLITDGLTYEKWGAVQLAHANDWLVENNGECYTVAAEAFDRTYKKISDGRFIKCALVRAYQATESGSLTTQEGSTDYQSGDYIILNDPNNPADTYAVARHTFEEQYTLYEQD